MKTTIDTNHFSEYLESQKNKIKELKKENLKFYINSLIEKKASKIKIENQKKYFFILFNENFEN